MYVCIVLGGSFVCCIYSPIYYLYFYYRICVKRKKLFNCHSSFPSRRLFFDGQAKIIFEFLSNSYCKRVWPGTELLIYVVCFQAMPFRDK